MSAPPSPPPPTPQASQDVPPQLDPLQPAPLSSESQGGQPSSSPPDISAPRVPASDGAPPPSDEAVRTIPRPSYQERQEPGYFFNLLGIGRLRDDRKPLQDVITKVWRTRTAWATTRSSYQELPEEERITAEADLQARLRELYPAPSYTASQIEACSEWLPGFLLAKRHKDRRRGAAARRPVQQD
ncbi:uncharacterized protein LAJ45_11708 [Morchella importuna]|uniref:uncharacterized protein n=1 Tax=Morchella importuna TaxID=1174673 RepID=UPI001E8E19BD|nr:uncharacterized protein LAJ45_11708 [Morchella importuna]KAH8144312.1 hypothetical protein LAJ45_11708 [Morchella importuna]